MVKKKEVRIAGRLTLGGNAPIAVQTMCNTSTRDIDASVDQCRRMALAGADLIRLTTQGEREVEALAIIKERLHAEGIFTPLVADIHFNADVALAAAKIADKVRINPGNFSRDHGKACSKFAELIGICKEYGTAIRIGLNHGSLGGRITSLYGDTALAMKEAVVEWLRMCVEQDFYSVVVSLKSSNTKVMVEAYRLLYKAMADEFSFIFPLHLGVTEAGNEDQGRIKSAVGIATLLKEGIGDTIRVSLTEDPVNEIPAGRTIVDAVLNPSEPVKASDWNDFIIRASCLYGTALLDGTSDDFSLDGATIAGESIPEEKVAEFKDMLLQACRRRFTKPEYIACPGCGRTMYNLEETFNEVKKRTSHLAGVKIAIMGCIVNGPGEMADADFGYVGAGRGEVTLYKGKQPVEQHIPQEEAIDKLVSLIESNLSTN